MDCTDGKFSLVAHSANPALLDIVDDEWLLDRLPDDEIAVPPHLDVPSEDEVGLTGSRSLNEQKGKAALKAGETWTELGLFRLENA